MVESWQEEPEGMDSGGREEKRLRLVMLDGNRTRKKAAEIDRIRCEDFRNERMFCRRNVKRGGTAEA
jgi:hypothetical protein